MMSQVNNGRAGRWLMLAAMTLSAGAWAAGDESVDPWQAAMDAAVQGPAAITLADQAELSLDSGELFIPAAEAEALMVAVGNGEDPTLLGLVMAADDAPWWVTVNYEPEGYISDEDAADIYQDSMVTLAPSRVRVRARSKAALPSPMTATFRFRPLMS